MNGLYVHIQISIDNNIHRHELKGIFRGFWFGKGRTLIIMDQMNNGFLSLIPYVHYRIVNIIVSQVSGMFPGMPQELFDIVPGQHFVVFFHVAPIRTIVSDPSKAILIQYRQGIQGCDQPKDTNDEMHTIPNQLITNIRFHHPMFQFVDILAINELFKIASISTKGLSFHILNGNHFVGGSLIVLNVSHESFEIRLMLSCSTTSVKGNHVTKIW
mmetsp:Transcript_6064/g.9288  ORF Transcript_6064/g.9288 Transcript_6064/m.9288 type:complete len:214 (-) Transcript_6064:655-1296(-)